jgi:hypothetical protein
VEPFANPETGEEVEVIPVRFTRVEEKVELVET